MIISDSHKFIFCRNMRAGTTSIKKRLELLGKDHIALNIGSSHYGHHLPMSEIRKHITKEQHQSYFKFAFVRNPWDRMASAYVYNHFSKATKGTYNVALLEPYDKWLETILADFPNYIKRLNQDRYLIYTSQVNQMFNKLKRVFRKPRTSTDPISFGDTFALNQYDFVKGVDFIGKYENLQEGFGHICGKLNIPHSRLKQLNRSFKPNYRSMYDEESRLIVAKHYAKDIKAFEYEF
jgi:hypothetical protein